MITTQPIQPTDEPVPSLEEWLAWPRERVAAQVQSQRPRLSVLYSIDGTRRHYLLAHKSAEAAERPLDFADYASSAAHAYVRVYDLLYSLGVHTILTPMLYPPNFRRSESYLQQGIEMSYQFLLNEPFLSLYQRWATRTRFYGDYDLAPLAASARPALHDLAERLATLTPGRADDRRLLLGYCAGSFSEELIARTVALHTGAGPQAPLPGEAALRRACFPDGPDEVNILIGAGWLRVGMVLPPVLDGGATDLYNLNHLALDLPEASLRRILYDHLFRRWAAPEDDLNYTTADLQTLAAYYDEHRECLTGPGQLVGPGMWYADHEHRARD